MWLVVRDQAPADKGVVGVLGACLCEGCLPCVSWCCTCVGLRRDGVGVWRWSETGVVNSIAGAWLGPKACSWQAAPRGVARIVTWWGCGLAVLHRAVFVWVGLIFCRNF